MKPEEQRIAIAKACGWRFVYEYTYNFDSPPELTSISPEGRRFCGYHPDYPNDLNAMHEAITQHGNGPQWVEFRSEFTRNLLEVVRRGPNYLDGTASWYFATATPMQLAEAFLKTLNLWKA